MTKEQASREWLELNKIQKSIRIKRLGTRDSQVEMRLSIIIEELEELKKIFEKVIDPNKSR